MIGATDTPSALPRSACARNATRSISLALTFAEDGTRTRMGLGAGCVGVHRFCGGRSRSGWPNRDTADRRELEARIVLREDVGHALAARSAPARPNHAHADAVTKPAPCKTDAVAARLDRERRTAKRHGADGHAELLTGDEPPA